MTAKTLTDGHQASNLHPPLAEDTVGPYYPYVFVDQDRIDLTHLHPGFSVRPAGQAITLQVKLLDVAGQPVPDALLEFWQANGAGVHWTPQTVRDPEIDPYFDGFGRVVTTMAPTEFRTIKPGAVGRRGSETFRAPHVTVTIFSDGIARLVTQIFFDDEADANEADPLLCSVPLTLRERLVAKRVDLLAAASTYEVAIVLRGEGETPFFDDMLS